MSSFTKGPWRQGVTLFTRQTSKWTNEQLAENNRRESVCIFAGFDHRDEGRSRQLLAKFERPEDAALAALAPELLEAVEICLKAEMERRAKLLPGAPATTYTQARIDRLESLIARSKAIPK